MGLKVTNNAFGTLNAGINSSATTIVLTAGQGARFPSLGAGDYFYATLIDTSNNLEIVKVTARSTDTMTVVRGQDSTTARAYSTNDRFELRPTAAMLNEITLAAENALPKAGGTMTGQLKVVTSGSISNSPTDSSEQLSDNLKLVIPNNSVRRVYALGDTATNYTLNNTGGAAVAFYRDSAGSDEIAFETHWTGNWHREQVRINKFGHLLNPYQPMFWAYRSGDGNVTSETDLSCNVADVNIGGHYNTSTFRFTAPVAGTYFFIVHAMNNQSNPGASTVYFSKNGSKYHYFHIVNNHPSSATSNVIMTLAANDYVSASAANIHWNGGSIYKYPVFGGFLIG